MGRTRRKHCAKEVTRSQPRERRKREEQSRRTKVPYSSSPVIGNWYVYDCPLPIGHCVTPDGPSSQFVPFCVSPCEIRPGQRRGYEEFERACEAHASGS